MFENTLSPSLSVIIHLLLYLLIRLLLERDSGGVGRKAEGAGWGNGEDQEGRGGGSKGKK